MLLNRLKESRYHAEFEKKAWHTRDKQFGNTPFSSAVAEGKRDYILAMLQYIVGKPELLYQLTAVNQCDDCCNTPLLLAVKNGDQETACQLLPFYSMSDLMHYDNNGLSALHLASYLKLNCVLVGILVRAEALGCTENILVQQNAHGYIALDLYEAPFMLPSREIKFIAGNKGEKIKIDKPAPHPKILFFDEAIGKHAYVFQKDRNVIDDQIRNRLRPLARNFDYLYCLDQEYYFFSQGCLHNVRSVELTPDNRSVVNYDKNEMLFRTADGLLRDREWVQLKVLLERNPDLAKSIYTDWVNRIYLSLLFRFAKYADDSDLCREVSTIIFAHSNWHKRNRPSANTPFLQALEDKNVHAAALMVAFIISRSELHYLLTTPNSEDTNKSCNTPLLMAIKKGDIKTACTLVPFYSVERLLFYDNNGQTALHLACYLKLNDLIRAILAQGKVQGCQEELLQQQNSYRFSARELYEENVQGYEWCHPCMKDYELESVQHLSGQCDPLLLSELNPKQVDFYTGRSRWHFCFFVPRFLDEIAVRRKVEVAENNEVIITNN